MDSLDWLVVALTGSVLAVVGVLWLTSLVMENWTERNGHNDRDFKCRYRVSAQRCLVCDSFPETDPGLIPEPVQPVSDTSDTYEVYHPRPSSLSPDMEALLDDDGGGPITPRWRRYR